jgi:hypothetical protein
MPSPKTYGETAADDGKRLSKPIWASRSSWAAGPDRLAWW